MNGTSTEAGARPSGVRRRRRGFLRSLALTPVLLAPLLALLMVVTTIPPAAAVSAPPFFPVIPALGGTAAGTGTVAAGGTGAAVAGGTATVSGSAVVGAIALFGATAWGTYKTLEWAFDSPPKAGNQPSLAGDGIYATVGSGAPFQAVAPAFKKLATCRTGGVFGSDPNAAGVWSKVYSACFHTGDTVNPGSSANGGLNTPAWRCITVTCSDAVKIVWLNSASRAWMGGVNLGGFTSPSGNASLHTSSVYAESCPGWGSAGYFSQAECQADYAPRGWDVWFDPSKIEFSPPPLQAFKTSKTCKNMTTGVRTTTTANSASFYGADSTKVNLAPDVACPAGSTPVSNRIEVCLSGGTACEEVSNWVANPRTIDPSPSDPYKDCLPGGANSPCQLKLYKQTATGWKLCDATAACHSFDPDYNWEPNVWRCEWGAYVVPYAQCAPLKNWTATTAANAQTDPDKTPYRPGIPGLDPDPNPEPTPEPTPTPQPSPSNPDPTRGTNPTAGAEPDPADPDIAIPDPGPETDPNSEGCLGKTWTRNPVSWVYAPVKCALLWAFRPPAGFLDARVGELDASFRATAPALWYEAVKGWSPGAGVSGCNGLALDVELPPGIEIHERIGAACSGAMANAAGVVRIAVSAMTVVGGGMACIRALGSGLGWNPSVGKADV